MIYIIKLNKSLPNMSKTQQSNSLICCVCGLSYSVLSNYRGDFPLCYKHKYIIKHIFKQSNNVCLCCKKTFKTYCHESEICTECKIKLLIPENVGLYFEKRYNIVYFDTVRKLDLLDNNEENANILDIEMMNNIVKYLNLSSISNDEKEKTILHMKNDIDAKSKIRTKQYHEQREIVDEESKKFADSEEIHIADYVVIIIKYKCIKVVVEHSDNMFIIKALNTFLVSEKYYIHEKYIDIVKDSKTFKKLTNYVSYINKNDEYTIYNYDTDDIIVL